MPFLDPFVDDSDEIAQVTAELKKRKLRTVHGGFFVSSGELEVEKQIETESKKTNQSSNLTNKNKAQPASASSAMLTSKIDKVQKILEKGPNEKGPVKGPKGDPGDKASTLIADGTKKADVEGGVKVPRVRVARPKPQWVPSTAAISALEAFREAYRTGNITIGKNGLVPQQVPLPLNFSY
jgi:hypothetical protein